MNADVNTHQVTFAVTDKSKFDQEAVKKALDDVGFNEMKLVSGPEKQ